MFIANPLDEQPAAMPVQPIVATAARPATPPPPAHNGPAYLDQGVGEAGRKLHVTNQRNGFTKTYATK